MENSTDTFQTPIVTELGRESGQCHYIRREHEVVKHSKVCEVK